MGDVVIKLFAAVLADWLMSWSIANGRICSAQKGFLPHEVCPEHPFVLQRILENAHMVRKEMVVAQLDLADAFDSVPHATIHSTLLAAFVPVGIVNTVMSLYESSTVCVRTREGYTHPIPALGSAAVF